MPRIQHEKRGFTLIELLVVIAIIGILASFILGGLAFTREKANVVSVENTLKQLGTILASYYVDHNSYPPGYGYLSKEAFRLPPAQRLLLDPNEPTHAKYFVTKSYMSLLGQHDNKDFYDAFALDNSDTDYDGITSRLEYFPPSGRNQLLSDYSSSVVLGQRPFIYVAVNLRQFRKVKEIWDRGDGVNYKGFPDFTNSKLQDANFHFPPASYDSFALVSAGLVTNTQGLIYDFGDAIGDLNPADYAGKENYFYHIAAMATYYMLTRDLDGVDGDGDGIRDGDGVRDYDYRARVSQDQDANFFPYIPLVDVRGNTRVDGRGRSYGGKVGVGIDGPIYIVQE